MNNDRSWAEHVGANSNESKFTENHQLVAGRLGLTLFVNCVTMNMTESI
jgi:hypothetical protein